MKKRRYLSYWIAVMTFILLCLPMALEADVTAVQGNDANPAKRSDIIDINTLKSFGTLERAEVPFLHDAHTAALKKLDKGCEECHLTDEISGKESLSPKFKRTEDTGKQEVMNIYHTNCIACHREMSDAGEKTGPVELCGDCHKGNSGFISSSRPIKFDKSLHYYHIELSSEECSVCHHGTVKEGSCRYCHRDEVSKKIISMESASHISCIGCHREISGPVTCSACHDPAEQEKISKLEDVPRIEDGQPDFALIGADSQDIDKSIIKMNPVPFDHKAHEQNQDSCRTCHHAGLESCSKACHTIEGSEKGNMITAEQAMHQIDSERSCLGCHEINKAQKECAGCHGWMEKGSNADNTCLKCHTEMPKPGGEENMEPESIAAMLLEERKAGSDTIDDKDIPETVTIAKLSHQYGAVKLPHRKIINALMLDINKNNMAGYFHDGNKTLCLGCHHNSPASMTPPGCASCHGKLSDDSDDLKPDLKVAYHRQCMGCHDRMGIEVPKSTNCASCHEVIGVNKLYDF